MLLAAPGKRIFYLRQIYESSVHDKKIADKAEIAFDTAAEALHDSGFHGFRPRNAFIAQPVKKPRPKELSDEQK